MFYQHIFVTMHVCLGGNDRLCFSFLTPKPHSSNSIISFPTDCVDIKVHSHVLSQTILLGLWIRRFSHFAVCVYLGVYRFAQSKKKKKETSNCKCNESPHPFLPRKQCQMWYSLDIYSPHICVKFSISFFIPDSLGILMNFLWNWSFLDIDTHAALIKKN